MKIGYQAGLKLLRSGARLIVTTRFPRDSAARYAQEPDFARVGRSARDLRARSSSHAERGSVLPRAARQPATGWTSSSTTHARRCAVRRISIAHMMAGETAPLMSVPEPVQRLLAAYERTMCDTGWRRNNRARECRDASSSANASQLSQLPLLQEEMLPQDASLPRRPARSGSAAGGSAAAATPGGCCWRRCRRSSCSKCSWSTPSRRSSSTRG